MTDHVEIWRVVPDLPEYEVSSWGRVMRVPFDAPMPSGGWRTYGGKIHHGNVRRATADAAHTYRGFTFRGKNYKVHQLVARAFLGLAPFSSAVVIHIDEDAHNNRADNLKWGTQKENLNAPGFVAYCKGRVGEDSPTRKHERFVVDRPQFQFQLTAASS